ncbi:MAG: alpha/beta hydrolase [Candidatus Methylomirabilis oxyfera]|nr:alpha/beta hydrolase [Candidatus Methylomirabilis oxyfera]
MLTRVNDLDTHFTLCGEGEPIVLLHGWGTSAESLGGIAKCLEDRFRVFAIDLPGFGWTPPPPVTWGTRDYAAHVEAFMESNGIHSANLLGHSFGGRIALALAAQSPHRVRRLVLVASAGIRGSLRSSHYLKVAAAKLAKRVFSFPIWGRLGERILSTVHQRVGSRDYRNAGQMRRTLVRVVNEDLRNILSFVQAPTLVIWGDRDLEVSRYSMEIMAGGIRGSQLEIMEGAGHFPFVDMPERFGKLLRDFLCRGET